MSRLQTIYRAAYGLAVVAMLGTSSYAQFAGPVESFDAKNQILPLTESIQQKNWPDAGARIDAVIHDNPDALFSTEGGGGALVSMRAWVETLPAATRAALQPEYDKINGEAAKQAMEAAVTKPGVRPGDFIAVANAFPLSSVDGEAWGRAAMRAVDFGDTSLATVLLKRAIDHGWKPTESQQNVLDAVTKVSLPNAAPVSVLAPWYTADPPIAAKRVIPVSAGGIIFVATERGIVAAKETGEKLWEFVVPKADGTMAGARLSFNRPAVLCDSAGKPQIVIVRQIIGGTRFGCLRAFRATDGKLLWTTETASTLGSWSLASAPTIAGRETLVIAIDDTARPMPVAVMAFETMTGRFLWQSQLGAYTSVTEGRGQGSLHEVDSLWSSSGVTVDGADVFVSAGLGLTASLDRFDGKIHWIRPFKPTLMPGEELIALARQMVHADVKTREAFRLKLVALKNMLGKTPLEMPNDANDVRDRRDVPADVMALGLYFSQPPRWLSTPAVAGDVVVVAATDMAGVVGLDRATGAQLWEIPEELHAATLLGVSGDVAIFSSDKLTAIDAHSSKPKWDWSGSEPIAGPPSLAGTVIKVGAGKAATAISAESGKIDPLASVAGGISPLLTNEATKNALVSIDALPSIVGSPSLTAVPPVKTKPTPEPKKKPAAGK